MQTYRKRTITVHPSGRAAGVALLLCALPGAAAPPAADDDAAARWTPDRTVAGVALQSRPADDGFQAYRGQVTVCTSFDGLQRFVGDPARFGEWIPFTEAAAALPAGDGVERYYLRTATPWPLASRDMIYRLRRQPADDGRALHIELDGEPDAMPPSDDAVRMEAASGLWTLRPQGERIDVELRLAVNPGDAPRFFANRRLATTVGRMLANLAERFSCSS